MYRYRIRVRYFFNQATAQIDNGKYGPALYPLIQYMNITGQQAWGNLVQSCAINDHVENTFSKPSFKLQIKRNTKQTKNRAESYPVSSLSLSISASFCFKEILKIFISFFSASVDRCRASNSACSFLFSSKKKETTSCKWYVMAVYRPCQIQPLIL